MTESKTVLMVDDEEGILVAYLACLGIACPEGDLFDGPIGGVGEFASHRFLLASSGERAVGLVEAENAAGRRVACGFFDMKMSGGIDGVETIRRLRAIDPDMLCTIVTADISDSVTQLERVFTSRHVDEWDYLAKPFGRWEIVQKCRNMLGSWNRRRREEEQVLVIQRLNRELETWGATLEKRVAERTGELAASQRDLRRKNADLEQVLEELSATQAQLVEHEKMASIGQLAAGVAQELGRPLELIATNIQEMGEHGGRLEAFLRRLDHGIPAPGAAHDIVRNARLEHHVDHVADALPDLIGQARIAAQRMGSIIGGLRAFSQSSLTRPEPVDVDGTIEAAITRLRERFGAGIQLDVDLGQVPMVDGDASALAEAWHSLLANALDAVEDGAVAGRVRVRSRVVDGEVLVEVEDNGCGMSPEIASRAFEPFFTTRPSGAAAGLGLSVAFGIVRRHGGDIDVVTAPDEGARFTVRLPASECIPERGRAATRLRLVRETDLVG